MNINQDKTKYKFLEDVAIADIAYEAYGKDLNELFENAALAIFELSANLETVDAKKKIEIKLENEKIENLLYDFLSEILFLKDSKYMVFKKMKVSIKETSVNRKAISAEQSERKSELSHSTAQKSKIFDNKKYQLRAVLEGDTINPQKQQLENDIKAVTMHMFEIKKEKKGYKATIVVDI